MGTNYYIKYGKKDCECCGSEIDKKLHIGKKSIGWEFTFQGYKELNLNSYKDWRTFLNNSNESIINEYGKFMTKEGFYKTVENSKNGENLNHTIEVQKDYPHYDNAILDSDGYSINYTDFS